MRKASETSGTSGTPTDVSSWESNKKAVTITTFFNSTG